MLNSTRANPGYLRYIFRLCEDPCTHCHGSWRDSALGKPLLEGQVGACWRGSTWHPKMGSLLEKAAAGREDAWTGAGGRRPAWHPLCLPSTQIIQKHIFLFSGEIFLCKGRCCWGEGAGSRGTRLCFWGGSFSLPPRLGRISGEKSQSPGLNGCLFWWHVYSGWVNKWWGRVPLAEYAAIVHFSWL